MPATLWIGLSRSRLAGTSVTGGLPYRGGSLSGQWFRGITPSQDPSAEIDTGVAHPARIYDYWLGGKDNFAADREAGDCAVRANPGILRGVRANRRFLGHAVRHLAGDAGIRQFLDT